MQSLQVWLCATKAWFQGGPRSYGHNYSRLTFNPALLCGGFFMFLFLSFIQTVFDETESETVLSF